MQVNLQVREIYLLQQAVICKLEQLNKKASDLPISIRPDDWDLWEKAEELFQEIETYTTLLSKLN
jgi:hypothetical protein